MTSPDVIVVGAGMVGAACAYELTREGLSVTIVDAAAPGSGTTAEGMGHVLVMDSSPAELELTRWSLALWYDLVDQLPDRAQFCRAGTMWLALDEAELEALADRGRDLTLKGITNELLDHRRLREAEPHLASHLAGGLRVPEDCVVYPPSVVEWLIDIAERESLASVHRARVSAIEGNTVRLSDGAELSAARVVDAAGLQALDLLAEPVPEAEITPRKGHLVITDRYPGMVTHQLLEAGYAKRAHASCDDSVAFNLQPRATGQLLLGSSRETGNSTRESDSTIVARMVRHALHFMPELADLNAIRVWTGLRPATPDSLPYIGPHPANPRTLIAAGHEGLGITTSIGTARIITDLVLGRESAIDISPYRLDRKSRPEIAHEA